MAWSKANITGSIVSTLRIVIIVSASAFVLEAYKFMTTIPDFARHGVTIGDGIARLIVLISVGSIIIFTFAHFAHRYRLRLFGSGPQARQNAARIDLPLFLIPILFAATLHPLMTIPIALSLILGLTIGKMSIAVILFSTWLVVSISTGTTFIAISEGTSAASQYILVNYFAVWATVVGIEFRRHAFPNPPIQAHPH